MGRERVGEEKVGRDCAVVKIPLKSHVPGPLLTLRQIDACDCAARSHVHDNSVQSIIVLQSLQIVEISLDF